MTMGIDVGPGNVGLDGRIWRVLVITCDFCEGRIRILFACDDYVPVPDLRGAEVDASGLVRCPKCARGEPPTLWERLCGFGGVRERMKRYVILNETQLVDTFDRMQADLMHDARGVMLATRGAVVVEVDDDRSYKILPVHNTDDVVEYAQES